MALSFFRGLDADPFFNAWPVAHRPQHRRDVMMQPIGAVDVKESDKDITFFVDAPGLTEKDVKVQLSDGVLRISGERSDERDETTEEDGVQWHVQERRSGTFSRQFALPANIHAASMQAHFDDGVLEVVVPKVPEKAPGVFDVPVKSKKSNGLFLDGARES